MPAPNPDRRRRLADTGIDVVAEHGLHGLTHRAVDRRAEEPAGTASNYFPSRDALVLAVAERLVGLQADDLAAGPDRGDTLEAAADSVAASLLRAATTDRGRWIAVFELQAEARRNPGLAAALVPLQRRSEQATSAAHERQRMPIGPESVPALQALYGGALQALLARPADTITAADAQMLARAMVFGVERPATGCLGQGG